MQEEDLPLIGDLLGIRAAQVPARLAGLAYPDPATGEWVTAEDYLSGNVRDIPRMREWNRTDLHGLAIISHQRHLPALDRENDHVFQADVLANAEQQGFGLMTTWDLFRLLQGFVRHGWHHDDVAGLFVAPGRVQPVPAHYKLIASVDGYWPQVSVVGLRIHDGALAVGDRIAYELQVDFIEEVVTSLRLDDQDVQSAQAGYYVGSKTTLSKEQGRPRVSRHAAERRQLTWSEHDDALSRRWRPFKSGRGYSGSCRSRAWSPVAAAGP